MTPTLTTIAAPPAPPVPIEPVAAARLHVGSEVGVLRRVLLHRPEGELARLTPANRDAMLFDDVPWAERARREHDAFADALADRGVEVLLLAELLEEVLADDAVRDDVVERTLATLQLGPVLRPALTEWLDELALHELVGVLLSGVAFDELPFATASLTGRTDPSAFAIPPLPNQMCVRDSSCWIGDGVCIGHLAAAPRRRERVHVEAVYRRHPSFAALPHTVWTDGLSEPGALEGGDVLVLGRGVVLIGLGLRTSAAGAEALAHRLLCDGGAREVLVTQLPRQRTAVHLDMVLTMVDVDVCTAFPGIGRSPTWRMALDRGAVTVHGTRGLFSAMARALEVGRLRVVYTGGDRFEREREQWDDGNNVLALAPGVVVAYERNVATNACLRDHGIEVIEVAGSELGRGRSGPRSLSCPIDRDDLPEDR